MLVAERDTRSLSADERSARVRDHLIAAFDAGSDRQQIDATWFAIAVLDAIEHAGLGPDRSEVVLSEPRYELLRDSLLEIHGLDARRPSVIRHDPHLIGKIFGIEFSVSVESSDSRLRYMDPTEELSVVVLPATGEVR